MRISTNKQNYMVKSVLFISFLFVMSLGLIGGCSDGGGEQNSTRALTEINFAEDSALRADLEGVVVTLLESPDSEEAENDTGEVGIDLIPIRYARTTEQTFCWEDDNTDAMHFMELTDSQGSVVLTVDVNGDCVEQVIEAGDYVMSIHHDGSIADSLPIFLIPDPEGSEQARETVGFIDRVNAAAAKIFKTLEKSMTNHARAEIVERNISILLSINLCPACNLRDADLRGADLIGAKLIGADLRKAKLIDANLSGADLSATDMREADLRLADLSGANLSRAILIAVDFRSATWCDGICKCSEGSIGTCNGCASVQEVCTGS